MPEALDRETALTFCWITMAMKELFKYKKLLFAEDIVGKKKAVSACMKAGWWELERQCNVGAVGKTHRNCMLY